MTKRTLTTITFAILAPTIHDIIMYARHAYIIIGRWIYRNIYEWAGSPEVDFYTIFHTGMGLMVLFYILLLWSWKGSHREYKLGVINKKTFIVISLLASLSFIPLVMLIHKIANTPEYVEPSNIFLPGDIWEEDVV